MPSLPLALALYTEKSNKGGVVRAQLAGFLRAGRPALSTMHSGSNEAVYNSDDGGKYSASEECTFSRTCKSRVLCRYREYRAGILVRVNLSISSFSCLR